jgi:hypothetical protein
VVIEDKSKRRFTPLSQFIARLCGHVWHARNDFVYLCQFARRAREAMPSRVHEYDHHVVQSSIIKPGTLLKSE